MEQYHGACWHREWSDCLEKYRCQLVQAPVLHPDDLQALSLTASREVGRKRLVTDDKDGRVVVHIELFIPLFVQHNMIGFKLAGDALHGLQVEGCRDVPACDEPVDSEGAGASRILVVHKGPDWR